MKTPKVPKVEKPKEPIDPEDTQTAIPARERSSMRGRSSLISAGRLVTKAAGIKSSLLG